MKGVFADKNASITRRESMPTEDHVDSTLNPVALKAALDKMRPTLVAMPPEEVVQVALDPSRSATVVVGSLPRIESYRAALEAQFGASALAFLDELPFIAYATRQADIELAAADSAGDLSDRFVTVTEDHQLLLTDAEALANRKLLDRARVDAGRPAQGYRTKTKSTLVLVALFRERWAVVKDKTPLTIGDLDAIEARAQARLKLLDERERGTTRLHAAELRTRALSRLIRTYGEVRRMLTYLRWWEADANDIAPSLWTGRRKARKHVVEEVVVAPVNPVLPVLPPPAEPNDGGPFTQRA
jgi:hypothetical protein